MDPFFSMFDAMVAKYVEFQAQIKTHILTFTYITFRGTTWSLTFSSELPSGQVAQIADMFTVNSAIIPWPPVKNVFSDIQGREKWVMVVNMLKASGTPEFKVTHFGQADSSQIPKDILDCFEQEMRLYKEGSPEAGTLKRI